MATRPKKSLPLVETVEPKRRGDTFSQSVVDAIIARVSGHESLRAICADVGVAPSTFMRWVADRPELAEQYAHAKRIQAETLASELVEIADLPPAITAMGATDAGSVAHQRLRVDTRKWIISKLLPKVYGDKLAIGGAADLPALQSEVNVTLDPSEAYKKLLANG